MFMRDYPTSIAQRVIGKFGGINEVAEILDVDRAWVNRWLFPGDKRGTNGTIPAKHHRALLDAANARGIPLTLDDFFETADGAAA